MKKYIGLIAAAIVIVVVIILVRQNAPVETAPESVGTNPQAAPVTSTISPADPSQETTTAVKTFTAAEVAAHNSAASCYAIVEGNVYDLTTWIGRHPGGEAAIKSLCGKDGTDQFNGQHGGQRQPLSTLDSFLIGTLAN